MIAAVATDRTIRRAIERGGYLRRSTSRLSDLGGFKEWLHFCVSSSELDVVVNFSLVDGECTNAAGRSEVARVTCAVRTDQWDGDVDRVASEDVRAKAGRMGLRFGESHVRYAGGTYHVVARLEQRPIEIDLSFRPITIASQVNNIALGDAPPMHWFVIPRLLATGQVRSGNQVFDLENVPAYHDHNWGHFRWGQDFAWTWGYGHAHSSRNPWGIAFDRLSNRARTADFLRGMLLWKGARHHRLFGGREIELRTEGTLRPDAPLRLPRVMALLRPESAASVPARLFGRAESRGDVLELEFQSRHLCQLLAPNDDDLGVTAINEVSGDLTLSGKVRGERIELDGRAMFEFLGD